MVRNFVHSTLSTAPLGSPLFALRLTEAQVLCPPGQESTERLFHDDRDAILEAAAHSVEHPSMVDGPEHLDALRARNEFAFALAAIGEVAKSEHQHALIASRYTEKPWIAVDPDRGIAVARIRKWAHANAERVRHEVAASATNHSNA